MLLWVYFSCSRTWWIIAGIYFTSAWLRIKCLKVCTNLWRRWPSFSWTLAFPCSSLDWPKNRKVPFVYFLIYINGRYQSAFCMSTIKSANKPLQIYSNELIINQRKSQLITDALATLDGCQTNWLGAGTVTCRVWSYFSSGTKYVGGKHLCWTNYTYIFVNKYL